MFQLGQISSKHGEQDVLNYKKVVAWSDVIGSGSKRMVLGDVWGDLRKGSQMLLDENDVLFSKFIHLRDPITLTGELAKGDAVQGETQFTISVGIKKVFHVLI